MTRAFVHQQRLSKHTPLIKLQLARKEEGYEPPDWWKNPPITSATIQRLLNIYLRYIYPSRIVLNDGTTQPASLLAVTKVAECYGFNPLRLFDIIREIEYKVTKEEQAELARQMQNRNAKR